VLKKLKHAIHPRPKGQGILAWLRKSPMGLWHVIGLLPLSNMKA
jgi:hypothetical protein